MTATSTVTESLRDQIRGKILSAKVETTEVEFYGAKVELRQPTLEVITSMRQASQDEQLYTMLIDYTYVPGTDEKVFEEADVDTLKTLPANKSFQDYMKAMNKLLGTDATEVKASVDATEKSS